MRFGNLGAETGNIREPTTCCAKWATVISRKQMYELQCSNLFEAESLEKL